VELVLLAHGVHIVLERPTLELLLFPWYRLLDPTGAISTVAKVDLKEITTAGQGSVIYQQVANTHNCFPSFNLGKNGFGNRYFMDRYRTMVNGLTLLFAAFDFDHQSGSGL